MSDKKILIIEDNLLNLELTRDILKLSGYKVFLATMAEAGIEIAKSEIPDLILMDLRLPGLSGLDAIKLLKQDPATKHIPIVVLTADALPDNKQKAMESGSMDYIVKPISIRQFSSLVADYLAAGKNYIYEPEGRNIQN